MDNVDFLTVLCVSAIKLYAYVFIVACMEWTSNSKIPAPNYLSYDDVWKSGVTAPPILNLSTGWRWVVSFMPWPPYSRGIAPDTHWIGGWVGELLL